ncbi:hypothetical protein [Ornithinimicrobium murale]|uniref:hypothetical protein n=1 Tax=Ornithinimicrobium murale TaxID=1050153 RepID=UPI000E0CC9E0|nr:hypothetical protein [Ornithinimicrobium murale]
MPAAVQPGVPARRFSFDLAFGELVFEGDMQGFPIEQVRFTDAEDQNIWDSSRLYIDGASWVWRYAVGVCRAYTEQT